jgi:hypothetical protein
MCPPPRRASSDGPPSAEGFTTPPTLNPPIDATYFAALPQLLRSRRVVSCLCRRSIAPPPHKNTPHDVMTATTSAWRRRYGSSSPASPRRYRYYGTMSAVPAPQPEPRLAAHHDWLDAPARACWTRPRDPSAADRGPGSPLAGRRRRPMDDARQELRQHSL